MRMGFSGRNNINRHDELIISFKEYNKTMYSCGEVYEKNLHRTCKKLRRATIKRQSYTKIQPKKGDFVYLDPPYDETYGVYIEDFYEKENNEFMELVKKLIDRDCLVMISNSDTEYIRDLYKDYLTIHDFNTRNYMQSQREKKKL